MQTSRSNKYINKLYKMKTTFCSACICADRKLYKLLAFRDIFKQICKKVLQCSNSEILLCFECLALLRNVKKFQEKVQNSQNILKSYMKDDEENPLINFSSLTTKVNYVLDCSYYNEALYDAKLDLLSDIKLEFSGNHSSDDFNTFDYEPFEETKIDSPPEIYLNETPHEIDINIKKKDIKEEILESPKNEDTLIIEEQLKEIPNGQNDKNVCFRNSVPSGNKGNKKERKKSKRIYLKKDRSELYKLTYLKKSWVNIFERVAIQPEEIKYWEEKERNSTYFKKLKNKCYTCALGLVPKDVKEHARRHSRRLQYTCDICTVSFASKAVLTTHIRNHYYIRSCTICGYKCIGKRHIYNHVKREHAARAVQCLECKANMKSTRDFYEHYRKEHYELNNVYVCDYCDKRFGHRTRIEKHIFNFHTPHPCKICNYTFSRASRLKDHNRLKHSVERTEASYCVKCDRQFDNVLQFRHHLNSAVAHAGERAAVKEKKVYPCPACPKVYVKGCTMRNHYSKVHATEARFQCAECDKKFLSNSLLRDHIKYNHQGYVRERKHICTVCGRGFTASTVLTKHMRTHTGERPYECPHCDAKFAQRTPMLTHIKNIHMKGESKSKFPNTKNI